MRERLFSFFSFILEIGYLGMMVYLVTFAFLKTTIWPIPSCFNMEDIQYFNEIPGMVPVYIQYLFIGIILLRCIIMGWKGIGYLGLSLILCGGVFYSYRINQANELIYLLFLILGAKDISFDKIMKIYLCVVIGLLGITTIASMSGFLENVDFGYRRFAFGIVSPTDFAAHVFFVFLCWWYVRGEKAKLWTFVMMIGGAVFIYYYSIARCSTICLILLTTVLLIHNKIYKLHEKKNTTYTMNPILVCMTTCAIQMAAIATLALSIFYDLDILWLRQMNRFLSERLELGKRGISICGFHLWGKSVELRGHWGMGPAIGKYFYLDSSYLQMTIIYGIVISLLLMLAFLIIGYRAYCSKKWVFLWVLALLAIHGMIEQRLWNISYCPFLLAVFARLEKS